MSWVRAYSDQRVELEDAEEKAKEYLRQRKVEVEEDLAPMRARLEKLGEMLEIFLREENGGKKYRVPGLGTVSLSHRRQLKVVDEDAFGSSLDDFTRHKLSDTVLSGARVRQHLKEALVQGEIPPGTKLEEKESLCFRGKA